MCCCFVFFLLYFFFDGHTLKKKREGVILMLKKKHAHARQHLKKYSSDFDKNIRSEYFETETETIFCLSLFNSKLFFSSFKYLKKKLLVIY